MKLSAAWFAPDRLLWAQTIHGAPVSMKNSRIPRLGKTLDGRPFTRWIRARPAQLYERDFIRQARRPADPIRIDVIVCLKIFYRNRRPDLDESIILDCLQRAQVLKNDRQVRFKIVDGLALDPQDPRVEIEVYLCPDMLSN
jgi:Holliday junction resolvase RusA-like endonuclease